MFLFRGFIFLLVGGLLACANASSSSSSSSSPAASSAPANRYQAIRDHFQGGNDYSQGEDFCLALDVILDVACDDNQKTPEAEYIAACLDPTFPSVLSNVINGYDSRAGEFLVRWFGQQATNILVNHKQRLKAGNRWELTHHHFDGVSDKEFDQFKLISCYTEFSSPSHPVPNPSFIMIQTLFESGFKDQLARWRNNLGQNLVTQVVEVRSDPAGEPLLQSILKLFPEDAILESVINSTHWNRHENVGMLLAAKPSMSTYVNDEGLSAIMFVSNLQRVSADHKDKVWGNFITKTERSHTLTPDLATPLRALRALSHLKKPREVSPAILANIVATGGEWGIDFGRAPKKQEWSVIRDTLHRVGEEVTLVRQNVGFSGILTHLQEILFNVRPSWSVDSKDEAAYLSHRQNAFIGAVIAAKQMLHMKLDDNWWKDIGSHVGLTGTQAKVRYEWLESQWQ
ncbi:hypothetical protein [Candidatus Finniella inopinata]|uniref:Uncharacterized protein n=1 Tax=Candidatus Finniella inopinata TaxID=1696036 RepID=A0A4Q7DIC6_9PROT|nr:hypothetical protein [Candidatus Finniella inopinata]RZI46543.1 hypothetical protein EQU50_02855 [Candidatus Finniella inopinata]